VKSGQILGQNNSPLDEAVNNRTYPRMDDELDSDENRKRNKESGMHLNVVKEGKPTGTSSRGA
jgi:hypothetical protein